MEVNNSKPFINGCPKCLRNGNCISCGRKEPRGKLNSTDWLEFVNKNSSQGLVEVLFKNTRIGFFENDKNLNLKIGDLVVVEGTPGFDIGRVKLTGYLVNSQIRKNGFKEENEHKKIIRLATSEDLEIFEEAKAREHSTMIRARSIAEDLGLDMKIGDVEFQGDGGKAIFYYIADERVDFRKLIRILAETFKVRIEMKQIGARQEAGRIGGIGPCGRPLCCATWLNRFSSVGTGSARLQDLSMNPQKLAGQCGKLKCCLNFEIDSYAEAQKELPPKDTILETEDNAYFLFKTDILSRKLTYSTDKHIPANLVTIEADKAFEIISLNKKGIKPATLSEEELIRNVDEFGDIIANESVTRFDQNPSVKSKKKKKAKTNSAVNIQETEKKLVEETKEPQNPNNNHNLKNNRRNNHFNRNRNK